MFRFLFLTWIIAINLAAFVVTGADKRAAQLGSRRVPEIALLVLAVAGGSPAMLVAMQLFRHKTRKSSFQLLLALIILLQAGLYRMVTG